MPDPLFPRRHPRLEISVDIVVHVADRSFTAVATDVSADGLFVACADPPPAGTRLRISVGDFQVDAVVMRVERRGAGMRLAPGAAGLEPRARWQAFVADLEKKQPAAVRPLAYPRDELPERAAEAVLGGLDRGDPWAAASLPLDATRDAVAARLRGLSALFDEAIARADAASPTATLLHRARSALPRLEAAFQKPGAREHSVRERGARTVLVVDDSDTARAVMKIHLALMKTRLEMLDAASGRAALEIIAEQQVDLVIADVNMPEIDGIELVRRIRSHARKELRDIPVIVVTGDADQTDLPLIAREAGASAVVFKASARLPTGRLTEVVTQLLADPTRS